MRKNTGSIYAADEVLEIAASGARFGDRVNINFRIGGKQLVTWKKSFGCLLWIDLFSPIQASFGKGQEPLAHHDLWNFDLYRESQWAWNSGDCCELRCVVFCTKAYGMHMDVSENCGTPKSSILIGFSIMEHLFWGTAILETPIWNHDWNQRSDIYLQQIPV